MITANQYIQTGFSIDDAEKLLEVVNPLLHADGKIVIDFTGVKIFTTLFFNNALAKFVMELGPDDYEKKFEVRNLSEVGETTYQHSLDNAKEYYMMAPERRTSQDKILAEPAEE